MELRLDANLKWLFTELDFEARFDAAANAGFAGVEYASPYEYGAAHLKSLLNNAGLKQVLINTKVGRPGTPTSRGLACLPEAVGEYRDGVLLGLEYATALGAEYLHVVGGVIPEGVSRDRAFAQYVANIAWAADQANGSGVRLLLEAQNKRDAPRFILETQDQAAAVVETVGVDRAGVLMDFYHAQIDEGDLIETFQRLQSVILHLQVADPPSRHEPGTGEIGYRSVFGAITAAGYAGWIGCEYRPRTDTVAGLGWIREMTA